MHCVRGAISSMEMTQKYNVPKETFSINTSNEMLGRIMYENVLQREVKPGVYENQSNTGTN